MRTTPFAHQQACFDQQAASPYHMLWCDPGTGKSKMTVDTADNLHGRGEINAVVVLAPNGVHLKWDRKEIPTHSYYPDHRIVWANAPTDKQLATLYRAMRAVPEDRLLWFCMNIEAAITAKGFAALQTIMKLRRCKLVFDESHRFKNPKAKIAKAMMQLRSSAPYRRTLTGTMMPQGPLDVCTQFNFLHPDILGFNSYYAFRARYATLKPMRGPGGRTFNVVDPKGYKNVEELRAKFMPYTFRAKKEECLDLPDKVYERVYVRLTPVQRKLYDDLKREMFAECMGSEITASNALTRFLRFQQLVGGFMPDDNGGETKPLPGGNPKLDMLLSIAEDTPGKILVWCRFRPEIALIADALEQLYGKGSVVQYHGGVDNATRDQNVDLFQTNDGTRFFVGQLRAGGTGLDLFAASTVVYYSNDFSLELRVQSEDRAHRIGQRNVVTYYDIEALDTLDSRVLDVLVSKQKLVDLVAGDDIKNWL